ncbi:hypothetical protein, partial [Escherichia coli]|uniref:hypothetical protein n=1 Tax=Escherichia coli TaxID=562 RepID=UPI001BB0EA01
KEKDLKKWMLDYSLQHGVDLASALRRGFVRRMCKAFIETPFSLTRRWRMTKLRGEKYDIFDVHAASNAASKYLGARGQRQEHSKKSLV